MTINKKVGVHVITSVERRRRWSIYEKKAIIIDQDIQMRGTFAELFVSSSLIVSFWKIDYKRVIYLSGIDGLDGNQGHKPGDHGLPGKAGGNGGNGGYRGHAGFLAGYSSTEIMLLIEITRLFRQMRSTENMVNLALEYYMAWIIRLRITLKNVIIVNETLLDYTTQIGFTPY